MRMTDVSRRTLASFLPIMAVFTAVSVCGASAGPEADAALPGPRIYAIEPPYARAHDVGSLTLQMTNLGVIGNTWIPEPSAAWGDGEYLGLAGLWIGAIASDNLTYVSTGAYEHELRPSLDVIDQIYEAYEGYPGGNRLGASAQPDDDGDGEIDEDFHDGLDNDGDGVIDEDFSAVSEQMFSCRYWDYTDEAIQAYPDHRPLYLKVHQRSVAWSLPEAETFVGIEFEIKNDGFEMLREVYLGLFVDSDVGPLTGNQIWQDDGGFCTMIDTFCVDQNPASTAIHAACNTVPLHIDMAYMYDIPDYLTPDPSGDVDGFFGLMLLDHTTDAIGELAPMRAGIHTCHFFSGSGVYPSGDPQNDFERYDLLSRGTRPRRPTALPDDYRYLISVGPFSELLPGDKLHLTVAFIAGEGYYDPDTNTPDPGLGNSGQPSENCLLAKAMQAARIFKGRWFDLDDNPLTGVDGRETCLKIEPGGEPWLWHDPCDSLAPAMLVNWYDCDDPEHWVDNDCSPCTPNQQQLGCITGGCESLIHWFTAPHMPVPNRSAGIDDLSDMLSIPRLRTSHNPSRAPVRFGLELAAPASGELWICDLAGRRVRQVARGEWSPGRHELVWDGRTDGGLPAGTGIYYLQPVGFDLAGARSVMLLR